MGRKQIRGPRSPGRLHFIPWRLIAVFPEKLNLHHVTILAPGILKCVPDFLKNFCTLVLVGPFFTEDQVQSLVASTGQVPALGSFLFPVS
jgi:hypothetical protein